MPEKEADKLMRRALWSGSLTFGLVNVPVALFPGYRGSRVALRMLSADGTPLLRRYYCPEENLPVEADEIVRGFEVEKGRYVVVTDAELESLEPVKSREIDLRLFVPTAQIDPIHLDRSYFLVPTGDSPKAYRLLAETMENAGRAGIATFVMRGKEYLVAIVAQKGVLRAETLRFAEEIRSAESIGLPNVPVPAVSAVDALSSKIRSEADDRPVGRELTDENQEKLRALIARKRAAGTGVVHAAEEEVETEGAQVIDLMAVLKKSIEGGDAEVRGGKKAAKAPSSGGAAEELQQKSKADLYAMAKALDISGRSGMDKKELIAVLRKKRRA